MAKDDRYTAEQLSQLGGVTLRTVRYYVQEGLIDRPEARGPGAHFTDRHLSQLKRCQLLQDWGFDLETIRDRAGSLEPILEGFAFDTSLGADQPTVRALIRAIGGVDPALAPREAAALKAVVSHYRGKTAKSAPEKLETKSRTERIPMADGIDLMVDKTTYNMPSPKELVDIALLVRKTFDAMKKPDDDDE